MTLASTHACNQKMFEFVFSTELGCLECQGTFYKSSPLRFNVIECIVESSRENVMGVGKCVNVRAFNNKSGRVGNNFVSTSLCELIVHSR